MKTITHALSSPTPGVAYQLVSHHFGIAASDKKIYIQAALHADETPAMLVASRIKQQLQALESAGRLRNHIIVVPVANPVGLSQSVLGQPVGRFETASGQNFNRGFRNLATAIADAIDGNLCKSVEQNRTLVRDAWHTILRAQKPLTVFESLHHTLMLLSYDADIVLDLHCSREAAMHLYTGEHIWKEIEPLSRYLGARASLLAVDSGGNSFDEAHSLTWALLKEKFGADYPMPDGTAAATIEHRGQRDVSYDMADQDATAILDYLRHQGAIEGDAAEPPPLVYPATPLAGSEQFLAPISGVLVHRAQIGDLIGVGQPLFDLIDPVTDECVTLHSNTEGIFYMRRDVRFVRAGDPLGRVTGKTVQRSGKLLSA